MLCFSIKKESNTVFLIYKEQREKKQARAGPMKVCACSKKKKRETSAGEEEESENEPEKKGGRGMREKIKVSRSFYARRIIISKKSP